MKAEQVDAALRQKFVTDDQRLVFWHDPQGEFAEYVAEGLSGDLGSVKVLHAQERGGLATKRQLEQEDPKGKYLVYTRGEVPVPEEDWLLDIRLYSAEFHADVASIWSQDLGLVGLSMRDHLKARATFLGSQDRRSRLKRLISPSDDEADIDLKMLAVVVGSPVATPFALLRSVCQGHMEEGRFDLGGAPEIITIFEKMGLLDHFWRIMLQEFGFEADKPSVAALLRALFVSELLQQVGETPIDAIAHFQLPAKGRRNAVVYLTQWRDSSGSASSYDATAAAVAKELKIAEHFKELSLESMQGVFGFWEAEKPCVSGLKARVLDETHAIDVDAIAAVATERKAGHWLAGSGRDLPERRAIADAYDAIVAAAELFALHRKHRQGLSSFENPQALLSAYREDLYRFDQLYRRFCINAKAAEAQGWDLLKSLSERVEQVYDHGFLQPLGLEWARLLDEGFLGEWKVKGLPSQQGFYDTEIRPHLAGSKRKRAYVIISDAFRYEAAQELTASLNGVFRMDAKLNAMLGVLPSYTALGMASLLPHKTLAYSDKGEVQVNDKSVAGTEARNKQLATVNGMACQAKDLRVMKLTDAREFTRDKRVVYIYHNVIDARGDTASTESETFQAVDDCIRELVDLVTFCINKLNAAKVWVTADHGFLFRQETPDITDKSKLANKPKHAVKIKKRYVIGRDLGATPEAHHGSIKVTAGADGDMEFWVPRGANRFHFTGGARFVHGGAMPQEVIVPLVTVSQLRGKDKESSRVEKVSVQVLGTKHKITTPKYRFEFIQTEAVGERRKPLPDGLGLRRRSGRDLHRDGHLRQRLREHRGPQEVHPAGTPPGDVRQEEAVPLGAA